MLLLVVLNIVITIGFAWLIKSFAVRVYLLVNYLIFVNPFVVDALFGVTHPLHLPHSDTYRLALTFVAAFVLTFCFSYMAWTRILGRSRRLARALANERINQFQNLPSVLVLAIALTTIALAAKFGLGSLGAFRMLEEAESSPFLQLLKILATFDILLLIFVGELRSTVRSNRAMVSGVFLVLAAISLYLALSTGSRFQTATVLVICTYSYRDLVRKHRVLAGLSLAAVVPTVFGLFPFLSYYRNTQYDLDEAVARYGEAGQSTLDTMLEVLATRLNYMETLAYAMDYVRAQGFAGGAVYLNNFIGLVPRLLWPDKPLISNDSQGLGHLLGIVTANDTTTSIGLRDIGEAFFELGWAGLLIATVAALMYALLQKNFYRPESRLAMTLYFYLTVYLVSRDGYFAILPGLVWMALACMLFFVLLSLLVQYKKRLPPMSVPMHPVVPPERR